MKILIVEDEQTLAKVMAEKIKASGYTVKIEDNGDKVVATSKSFKPDLILLDLVLPGKYGMEVLHDLKSDKTLNVIPVIIISNLDNDEEIKKALSLGAVDYFVKSQHPLNEIVDKIEEYIGAPGISRRK
ncbi:MAG: response regulator [Patescibacteria group bacterium]